MTYQLVKNDDGSISEVVVRLNDDGSISYIPNDPRNIDRQAYNQWLAAGNTPNGL